MNTFEETKQETTTDDFKSVPVFTAKDTEIQEITADDFKSVHVFTAEDKEIFEIADIVYADYIRENQKNTSKTTKEELDNTWKTTKEELDKIVVTSATGGKGKWRNESVETFGILTQQPLTKIQIGFLIQNFAIERNMGRGKITRNQLLKSLATVKIITSDDPDNETQIYIFGIFLV